MSRSTKAVFHTSPTALDACEMYHTPTLYVVKKSFYLAFL